MQLEEQLHEKKVDAVFTAALRAHLARKGFDPLMGARPMQRLIQDTIRKALADELLFGRLVGGGKVTVDFGEDEQVQLVFGEPVKPAAAREAGPADAEGEELAETVPA
jgi:ATP-dependent Clp protease ATP-binding subunit ClpA